MVCDLNEADAFGPYGSRGACKRSARVVVRKRKPPGNRISRQALRFCGDISAPARCQKLSKLTGSDHAAREAVQEKTGEERAKLAGRVFRPAYGHTGRAGAGPLRGAAGARRCLGAVFRDSP
ncbi:unnamed protein product, partial [Amoebophrya sp. A120]|eukprot:GSA120T00010215001.1